MVGGWTEGQQAFEIFQGGRCFRLACGCILFVVLKEDMFHMCMSL